ncbi:hypothetical protein DQ04_12181010, partial [Trypanosoma grayi]|uniref:hypothetical protein n=1 Tax=Trypanosoma grayi TaxID=71804 RepID=UPI0004F455D2
MGVRHITCALVLVLICARATPANAFTEIQQTEWPAYSTQTPPPKNDGGAGEKHSFQPHSYKPVDNNAIKNVKQNHLSQNEVKTEIYDPSIDHQLLNTARAEYNDHTEFTAKPRSHIAAIELENGPDKTDFDDNSLLTSSEKPAESSSAETSSSSEKPSESSSAEASSSSEK